LNAKIKQEKETLYTIHGKWDGLVEIKNELTKESTTLWNPTPEVVKSKLPKQAPEELLPNESHKLWGAVTTAILRSDQNAATDEKAVLENSQREYSKRLQEEKTVHKPKLFVKDSETGIWTYKYFNGRKWNAEEEIEEYEKNGMIKSLLKISESSTEEESEEDEELSKSPPVQHIIVPEENTNNQSLSQVKIVEITNKNNHSNEKTEQLETRIYRLEKDILSLQTKPLQAKKETSNIPFFQKSSVLLLMISCLVIYVYFLQSRIIILEQQKMQ